MTVERINKRTFILKFVGLFADYTKVDEAITKANALNKDDYKDFSAVEAAVNAVVRDKNITEQSEVDAMAKAIEDAIAALQYKGADYTKVDEAIAKANALNKDDYKDFSAVDSAVNAVVRDKISLNRAKWMQWRKRSKMLLLPCNTRTLITLRLM